MTFSALDHPILSALLGDDEIAVLFAFPADWRAMLDFESALAAAQAAHGLIPPAAATRIAEVCATLAPEIGLLREGVARDGVVTVALVKQLRAAVGAEHGPHLHRGVTSQDVIDTALMIRLKRAAMLIDARLLALIAAFDALSARDGDTRLMARTRMQRALPFTARDKIANWRAPLARHRARLAAVAPHIFAIQFGGPIGVRDPLSEGGDAVAADLARRLGLADAPCWHSQRDRLFEFAAWLTNVTGTLGKFGQDIALMAQNEVADIRLAGGGGSSAMAHKSNPVKAEALVALARYAGALHGGLAQALVHENERSGAAWTLEWLTLPSQVGATAAATRNAISLCGDIEFVRH